MLGVLEPLVREWSLLTSVTDALCLLGGFWELFERLAKDKVAGSKICWLVVCLLLLQFLPGKRDNGGSQHRHSSNSPHHHSGEHGHPGFEFQVCSKIPRVHRRAQSLCKVIFRVCVTTWMQLHETAPMWSSWVQSLWMNLWTCECAHYHIISTPAHS